MSALKLLIWINAWIAIQVVFFALLAFHRHWRAYRELQRRAAQQVLTETRASAAQPLEPAGSSLAWDGYREFVVRRKEYEDPSRRVCSFYLAPADGRELPAYRPGQFLTFRLDIAQAGASPRPVVRCYSLSDRPRPDHYRISIKRVLPPPNRPEAPPGLSSNYFHDHVQVGDRLSVRAPGGHFVLADTEEPVVLIAGGIGITPLLSMLNAALDAQPQREIWLYYSVRNAAEHAMRDHLHALSAKHKGFHLITCYSRPHATEIEGRDFQHCGRIDLALLRMTLPLRAFQFYVCGPRQMLETLVPALQSWGVAPQRIHYEAFGPASLESPKPDAKTSVQPSPAWNVTFKSSGVQALWDDRAGSLLEFAESLGLNVDSGCRAGSCGSCQITLEAGEVQYAQRPDFDPEAGSGLLCISRPRTDVVLLA